MAKVSTQHMSPVNMFSLTSYVWSPLNGFEYLPPQMPSRAQIKGKLCIEYPFIFGGLEMKKLTILQNSICSSSDRTLSTSWLNAKV